jgi:hypothetical protein
MEISVTLNFRKSALALCASGLLLAAAPALATQLPALEPGNYTIQLDPFWFLNHSSPAQGYCLIQGNNGFGGPERYFWGPSKPDANTEMRTLAACGFPTRAQYVDNGQGVYIVKDAGLSGPDGEHAYVLVNKRSGQCLQYDRFTGKVSFSKQGCEPGTTTDLSTVWWIKRNKDWQMSEDWTFSPIKPAYNEGACLIFGNNGYDVVPTVHRWGEFPSDRHWCGLGSFDRLESTLQGLFYVKRIIDWSSP